MTHKIKLVILSTIVALPTTISTAQTINSGYFTDQLYSRHTLNPAFSNENDYVAIPVLGGINLKMQGNFGLGDILFDNPVSGRTGKTTFMNPYISMEDALEGFHSDNEIQGEINIAILSGGFKAWGGYNTVAINSRTMFGLSVPYDFFAFAKNTGNNVYDLGDMGAYAQSYVELALGHSREITEKLRVGAKIKFLFGLANMRVEAKNMYADLSEGGTQWILKGDIKADVAMSGFSFKTEEKEYNIPRETGSTYTQVSGADMGFGLSGFGLGFDLGATYKITDDITVSAAVLDLGFISWGSNKSAKNSSEEFVFDGFHDAAIKNVEDDDPDKFSNQLDAYKDQLTDFMHLQEDEEGSKGRTTGLAATINIAGEYRLPMYKPVTIGLLSSTRIYGHYTTTEGRLSANYEPLKWLDGGINFAYGTYGASFGWLLNIHPKWFNFYIGMDHVLGKCTKEWIPLSSRASLALGMAITF